MYFCRPMNWSLSFFLSLIVFVSSFQQSLIFVDYEINREFYLEHCENKTRPELLCNGKCQLRKDAEKYSGTSQMLKICFEFVYISPYTEFDFAPSFEKIFFQNSFPQKESFPVEGFSSIPVPPLNC